MDNLLGGNADGGALNLGNNPLEQWFFEMPPCTRYWTVATVVTSVLLQCKVISPLQLFYTFRAVYFKSQVSRSNVGIVQTIGCEITASAFVAPIKQQ